MRKNTDCVYIVLFRLIDYNQPSRSEHKYWILCWCTMCLRVCASAVIRRRCHSLNVQHETHSRYEQLSSRRQSTWAKCGTSNEQVPLNAKHVRLRAHFACRYCFCAPKALYPSDIFIRSFFFGLFLLRRNFGSFHTLPNLALCTFNECL